MRLTTVTISGFKSFAKKTVIDVRKNITGIVGPNGSGKSNIAEAIRFVLGEQSMKSMRGGGGSDLIFKGSGNLAPLSRATVSLTLSNLGSDTRTEASDRIAPFLAYEEIVLAREIFADGGSDYSINGAKVRLKDVEELLALSGIGNNKHTILNQGEADRVLLLSPRERKSLIEDALGLKVFQIRIEDATKKLEKTKRHLDEVRALEREIKPHVAYLERQIEKIKKYSEEKERFRDYAKLFFCEEKKRVSQLERTFREIGSTSALELLLVTLEKDIKSLQSAREKQFDTSLYDHKIAAEKQTLSTLEYSLREKTIACELAKKEAAMIALELSKLEKSNSISYKEDECLAFRSEIFTHIDGMRGAFETQEQTIFFDEHDKTKLKLNQFLKSDNRSSEKELSLSKKEQELLEEASRKDIELLDLRKSRDEVVLRIASLEKEREDKRELVSKEEKRLYTMRTKASELRGTIGIQREKELSLAHDIRYFERLLGEATLYLGEEVKEYPFILEETPALYDRFETLKLLEKSKLRLEEGAITSSDETTREYEKIQERSAYLKKEIDDILASEAELLTLIQEVRSHMEGEYKRGIERVSESFTKYFSTVFKGGEARLVQKMYEQEGVDDEEIQKVEGIDIDVKLPSKKVKSIAAFSGGEKALTAIALLFALAEVAPPPFIVLDETDAPLDEHNAKRYGETLALLSEKSKLLVITHNRETMSHCEMLYGVTLGVDGASKLLSVDLK